MDEEEAGAEDTAAEEELEAAPLEAAAPDPAWMVKVPV